MATTSKTTGKIDVPVSDTTVPGITSYEANAVSMPAARTGILARLWAARGFYGGLAAIGLAALGQQALLTENNGDMAFRYYAAAMILLALSLLHPALPRFGRDKTQTSAQPLTVETETATAAQASRANLWTRWRALRARLGWRMTAPGLALALVLWGASTSVLLGNIASPLGGWLWAVSLAVLLLTFVGAEGWPRGEGLLPGPQSEFFARGVPTIPIRWEVPLALGMMLVALFFRVYNLEYHPGIFGDEGEQGMDARAINQGATPNIFGNGWWGVPNLAFYVWRFSLLIFGDTMTGLRMFGVIAGMVSVWAVYLIARMLWGQRAGLLAGTLLAVSPVALQFSRFANVSSETSALWAVGFYFLFMALRHRRWSDWVLAGFAWSINLYFYPAGKLIIGIIGMVGFYCLLRWHMAFLKKYALGFALMGLAFVMVFTPYAIFSAQDNWVGFAGRAQETSIFTPGNQPQIFNRHAIPYNGDYPSLTLTQNLISHPTTWALILFQQMRVTTEVLNRSGDPTPYYQIQEHGGSLLAPLLAVIVLLGLAYAASKFLDPRFGLISIWFWGGLLGAALTTDTPSVQRLAGAWPAVMIFPAVVLDRVFAASWPLSIRLARQWAAVPLAALLIFFGADGFREYFVHYASLCPYCPSTAQARYAQTLGQEYKAYQLGVGGWDVFFNYGSTRFAAKGVEGVDLAVPIDSLPVTDNNGKGVAFILYSPNYDYLPLIRVLYPGGVEQKQFGGDGREYFTTYQLTREQMAGFQTVHATYTMQNGKSVKRDEPNIGKPAAGGTWTAPKDLTFPAAAAWDGALIAPIYGSYTLQAGRDHDFKLEIDGKTVLPNGNGGNAIDLVLAKGVHAVRLSGTLKDAGDQLPLLWGPAGGGVGEISAKYLYNGPTGGLSAEAGQAPAITDTGSQIASATDPLGGQPVMWRRSDVAIGYREATVAFGTVQFIVHWQATIQISTAGNYMFETSSNGPSVVMIDDKLVVGNGVAVASDGGVTPATASILLTPGAHSIDVRYTWKAGPARMELFWTPPGGVRALIPPTVLTPKARSWTTSELPGVAPANIQPGQAAAQPAAPSAPAAPKLAPDAVIGSSSELKNARGLAVDDKGNVYVGDRGNHRMVVYSPDGKIARTWGKAPTNGAGNSQPGEFDDIRDVAVKSDGSLVYVLDGGARTLQIFNGSGEFQEAIGPQKTGLSAANGICIGPDGSIYIADTGGTRIVKIAPSADHNIEAIMGKVVVGQQVSDKLEQPVDMVAPTSANSPVQLYAIDLKDRVVQIAQNGAIAKQWPVPVGRDDGGSRLAISPDGQKIYMSDPERQRVAVLDVGTGGVSYFGEHGTGQGQFNAPSAVATGPDGRVYVLDRINNNIQVFTIK